MMSPFKICLGTVAALTLSAAGYWIAGPTHGVAAASPTAPAASAQIFASGVCAAGQTGSVECRCILSRAATHQALDKAAQLPDFTAPIAADIEVEDAALADAYYRGTLQTALQNFNQQIPAQDGQTRDDMQAMSRQFLWRAAKSVGGACLPESRFATLQAFHATGLAKSSTMARVNRAYARTQSRQLLYANPAALRR